MPDKKNYVQTYNSRSKKWVLIETGKRGGMTGKMKSEKFEGVPVANGKPAKDESPEDLPEVRKMDESESKKQAASDEKPKQKNSILSIFTGKKG